MAVRATSRSSAAGRNRRCVSAIGQDSHRFERKGSKKELMLGGVTIPGCPGLSGNSDADVILHAVTNAISGISGINILGAIADALCLDSGVRDSRVYLKMAIDTLRPWRLTHVAVSVEAMRPRLSDRIPAMRKSIAGLCGITADEVGITATSGEGLTAFGKGLGIAATAVVSAER